MSVAPKNEENKENIILNNNEEALALKNIYNIYEENYRNKGIEDTKENFLDSYNINDINLNTINVIDINYPQKNKYKKKLQKILFRK